MIDRSLASGSPRYGGLMKALLLIAASVAVGGTVGFIGFVMVLERSRESDVWPAYLGGQTPGTDVSVLARDATYEMEAPEALYWTASTDSNGEPLDRRRHYHIVSESLPARFWSVTLYDTRGRLLPNAWERYSVTSLDVAADPDGSFTIDVSPQIQPDDRNSIPTGLKPGDDTDFIAYLRLYHPQRAPETIRFPTMVRIADERFP